MTKRRQSANRVAEAVQHAVRAAVRDANVGRFVVACSGGADSVCLLDAVARIARQEKWHVIVGHVQHGVRADDHADVAVVRGHAERLSLPFRVERLDWAETTGGPDRSEATLRTRRYRALVAIANAAHAEAILTGHTMDDQAETVLLHFLRGAGLDGLRGMEPVAAAPIEGESMLTSEQASQWFPRLVRPLLSVRRADTAVYCLACDLPFIADPTNADLQYTRNWLRHDVLPNVASRFGDVAKTIARNASVLAVDADYLAGQTEAALIRCLRSASGDLTMLHAPAFAAEHPALQRRVLRALIQRLSGNVPNASDIQQLFHAMTGPHTSVLTRVGNLGCLSGDDVILIGTPDAVRAEVVRQASDRHPLFRGTERIIVGQPYAVPAPPHARGRYQLVVAPRGGGRLSNVQIDVPLALPEHADLVLRNRLPGDRFHPAGRTHSLRVQDYLTAQRIPALVRDCLPLLVVDGTIACVIGYDVSAAFAATDETGTHRLMIARLDT